MRARRDLIPSSFLVLLLPLILVSCNGGGSSETTQSVATPPPPPAPAGLLYRTDTALIARQTDGTGQVTLADEPNLAPFDNVFVSGSTVVYHTVAPIIPPTQFGLNDIWQVQTNGTGTRAVVATADADNLIDVFGPWVLYEQSQYVNGTLAGGSIRSARFDGQGGHLLTDVNTLYHLHLGDRAVLQPLPVVGGVVQPGGTLISMLPDGTDVRTLTTGTQSYQRITNVPGTSGSQVLFTVFALPGGTQGLFAVPVTGGQTVTLSDGGSDYSFLAAVVGSRVVYAHCPLIPNPDPEGDIPIAGPCDLASVLNNGTGTVVLSTTPENEAVQGVIGTQVIVRRNVAGDDPLYAVSVDGSGEDVPITSLGPNEFVAGIVGQRIVLMRPTGFWSVRADGSDLIPLTVETGNFYGVVPVGPFACFSRGPALWCVPADGSGPATKVTDQGQFVAGL